jgi:hypothetical protein
MIRVAARGKTGTVILRDERPDGSYVLLVCEEFEPSGDGGVLDLPADEEEYPMLGLAEKRTVRHARMTGTDSFNLEVDISAMPPGELRFRNREFIEQSVEQAAITQRAEITPDSAASWGIIGGEHQQPG